MLALILIITTVLAAGVAGFWAGVKHAEKARAIKDVVTK